MFRAWSKNEKKYIYDFCMTNSGIIINKVYSHENYIIEQSTGISDCNEVEVYEGDIIRECFDGSLYRVLFADRALCFMFYDLTDKHYYLNENLGDFEVIGNIHENPELIVE